MFLGGISAGNSYRMGTFLDYLCINRIALFYDAIDLSNYSCIAFLILSSLHVLFLPPHHKSLWAFNFGDPSKTLYKSGYVLYPNETPNANFPLFGCWIRYTAIKAIGGLNLTGFAPLER